MKSTTAESIHGSMSLEIKSITPVQNSGLNNKTTTNMPNSDKDLQVWLNYNVYREYGGYIEENILQNKD